MRERAASRNLALAMATPPLAWFVYQQGLGAVLRFDCTKGSGWTGLVWGFLAIAACLGAVLLGRRASTARAGDRRDETLRLLTALSFSSAALFGLAILYQVAATLIIPSCAR